MIQYHESDVAFSKKDLLFAAQYQISEMRLIGRTFIFSLKPLDKGWPDPEILAGQYDEIDAELVSLIQEIRNSPDIRENSWDPEVDILKIRSDMVCKKLAGIFLLDYRRAPFLGCYNYPKNR